MARRDAAPAPTPTQTALTAPTPAAANPALSSAPPLKTRRRPLVFVLAILLIVLGSLLAAFVVTVTQKTVSVVATRTAITRGNLITAEDLITVDIPPVKDLNTIPAAQLKELVGKRTAQDLQSGGLVSAASVTDLPYPGAGMAVVGMSLKAGQLPTIRPLRNGDKVTVVYTPKAQDELKTAPATGSVIDAEVLGVSRAKEGADYVVDVRVPVSQANELASIVATQRVALILRGQ